MGGSNNRVLKRIKKYLHQESLDKRKQTFDFKLQDMACLRKKMMLDIADGQLRSGIQESFIQFPVTKQMSATKPFGIPLKAIV